MDKRKLIKRISSIAAALFVALCAVFCLPSVNAHANVANGAVRPNRWSVIPFDFFIAHKNNTGYNYYLDWAFNSFADRGYNYAPDYKVGTNYFQYSGTPYFKNTTSSLYNAAIDVSLITNLDLTTYDGYLELFTQEVYLPKSILNGANDGSAFAYFTFGDGHFTYDLSIEFDLNYIYFDESVDAYQTKRVHLSDLFHSQSIKIFSKIVDAANADTYFTSLNLLQCFNTMLSGVNPSDAVSDRYFLSNVSLKFTGLTQNSSTSSSSVNGTVSFLTTISRRGGVSPYEPLDSINSWFDSAQLEVNVDEIVVESDFPTDWTSWLGKAVEGFFNFEVLPGFRIGVLFLAVFGVLILWFLLHLFM